jgi:hypothetical protein
MGLCGDATESLQVGLRDALNVCIENKPDSLRQHGRHGVEVLV